jgi:hypothetical protein
MDKRQKQVFRLVTLLPAFPAVASGTRGEQVLRLTAAGPLPDLTGFPMKLVAALLPAQDGKRCLTCQHRVFVSILQHFEIIVKNYKSAPKQAICQSPRQFWAGGIFESADHSACVVFHNLPPCRSPLFCIKKGSPPGSRFPDRRSLPDGTARVQTAHPAGIHVATGAATGDIRASL